MLSSIQVKIIGEHNEDIGRIEVSTFDEKDVKHFKDIVLGVDFIYMPIDKVWIRKEDFQKLNTHFYSRMFVKL